MQFLNNNSTRIKNQLQVNYKAREISKIEGYTNNNVNGNSMGREWKNGKPYFIEIKIQHPK
jgi:hypothetical protein